ncbi:MAG: hypothetical protein KA028_01750 [Candidatus Pacebacteria bacterium]|nr:hypothetical protein [Candidatus Paceibacterota bacterium]MBP9852194.1 hypothetical protein [Candidatus Paceibacterota bacterium]
MERKATGNENDRLHQLGNDFDKTVGEVLKGLYPATYEDLNVDLISCRENDDQDDSYLKLVYTVTIVPTDSASALYYFARRGAMGASSTYDVLREVKDRADIQINSSRNNIIALSENPPGLAFVRNSYGVMSQTVYRGNLWIVYDNFIAVGK